MKEVYLILSHKILFDIESKLLGFLGCYRHEWVNNSIVSLAINVLGSKTEREVYLILNQKIPFDIKSKLLGFLQGNRHEWVNSIS